MHGVEPPIPDESHLAGSFRTQFYCISWGTREIVVVGMAMQNPVSGVSTDRSGAYKWSTYTLESDTSKHLDNMPYLTVLRRDSSESSQSLLVLIPAIIGIRMYQY